MTKSDSDVGEVSVDGWTTLRWTIDRYMQKPQEVDTVLWSPFFTFRGVRRCLLIVHPNGRKSETSEGWMGIRCRLPSLPPASTVTCCMVDREGREILHTEMTEGGGARYEQFKWIPRRELEARSEDILPGGTLRVVVRVVRPDERGHRAEEEEESGAQAGETSSSGSSDIDCTRRQLQKGEDKLLQDLKDLFARNKDCDFIIRVKDREFRTHRTILKARIPAFDAMLSHDTAENKEGIVKLEDCDPDVFHEFLLFVYSGRVENVSSDNMCGLYVLADKYDLPELKEVCLEYMKSALSVEMICDVISLAIQHGETELLKLATNFFAVNVGQILETVKWQVFLQENPTEANELLIQMVKLNGKVRKCVKCET